MYLALREIRHARLRTALIVAIIALVAWLVFLLSGLAEGLAADNGASLRQMEAQAIVFEPDVRLFMHRSILPMSAVEDVAAVDGVTAATPIGHLTVTMVKENESERLDATILAIDPSGFLAPAITEGAPLVDAEDGGVIVDETFKQHGVALGESLQVTPSGQTFTVAGFTKDHKYNHLPVVFMPIPDWQTLKFASLAESGGIADPISAVAVQGADDLSETLAAALPQYDVGTRQDVLEGLPGYSSEMSTVQMILGFLFLIASLVMAAFFYVITLQKTSQFGVLKAIGAKTRTLTLDMVGQVVLLTIIGAALGAVLANVVAALIPANVPFSLSNQLVAGYSVVLVVVAVLGSLLSAARIARIDPLIAIGRVD